MTHDDPRYDVISSWPMAGWYVRDTLTLSAIGLPIVVRTFAHEASARQWAGALSAAHAIGKASVYAPSSHLPTSGGAK